MAAPVAAVPMVPINTRLAEPELVHLLGEAAPRAVFFDAAHRSMVETLRDRLPSVERWIQWGGEPAEFAEAYEPLLEAATPLEPVEVDAEHPWAVIYTGGTTGMPKGVVLSRRAFTFNLNHILRDLSWGQQPRFLQVTPLFHLAALGPSYAVSAWGGTQVFLPAFSMDSLLEQLSANRCQATCPRAVDDRLAGEPARPRSLRPLQPPLHGLRRLRGA
jgi:long-chain acyl-CoA synthetase